MGFWDVIRGVSRPKQPKLDQLFSVPGAVITLQTALGFTATGRGGVCYRAAEGQAAGLTTAEARALAGLDSGHQPEQHVDEFGFTWLTMRTDPLDSGALVTDLHAVNSALEAEGFASGLLCSVVAFTTPAGDPAYLVYLYKQGTFYPFAPVPGRRRDEMVERQMRDVLANDLPLEQDASRWMPLWDLPV